MRSLRLLNHAVLWVVEHCELILCVSGRMCSMFLLLPVWQSFGSLHVCIQIIKRLAILLCKGDVLNATNHGPAILSLLSSQSENVLPNSEPWRRHTISDGRKIHDDIDIFRFHFAKMFSGRVTKVEIFTAYSLNSSLCIDTFWKFNQNSFFVVDLRKLKLLIFSNFLQ